MTQNISVSLPNDIVYVSGIVNGVEYTFTLTDSIGSATIWTADVERATPDIYLCTITATASTGSTSTLEITLYYGLANLITDRTAQDVQAVMQLITKGSGNWTDEERALWLSGMKGAYNASDLNRVESAVNYILERYKIAGIFPVIVTKNTWQMTDFMNKDESDRYLYNMRVLRSALTMPANAPEVPADMDRFTYQEANDIESILLLIDSIITNIIAAWYFSGEVFSGEVM